MAIPRASIYRTRRSPCSPVGNPGEPMVRIVNEALRADSIIATDPSAGANQGANGRPGRDAEGIMRNDPQWSSRACLRGSQGWRFAPPVVVRGPRADGSGAEVTIRGVGYAIISTESRVRSSLLVHRWLGQQRGIRENPIGTLRRAPLRRPRRKDSCQKREFRAVCGRIANIKDSLLEQDEFELSGDFINGQ